MKRLPLAAIRFYQRQISPGIPPACRFEPTCSHYAYDSIDTYGTIRGSVTAIWRIVRCNPLNDGGYDPVPERAQPSEGRSRA